MVDSDYLHFTDEQTGAQRGQGPDPGGPEAKEARFEAGSD